MRHLIRVIAIGISIIGVLRMMGFVFGIQPVQSLFPQFGPRIFITAVAFTCSGIILYAIV